MSSEVKRLREFGKFQLDVQKRVLWFGREPVRLPLKEIELLCVLTEKGGEVVTKEELLERVWENSFVEESNISRHIYRLRKLFKDFGESEELIQTVPRRGYRFAGEVHEVENEVSELAIERHSVTKTLIEEFHTGDPADETETERRLVVDSSFSGNRRVNASTRLRVFASTCAAILILCLAGGFAFWRYGKSAARASEIKSIAVLPFKTIDAREENSRQGLGLADLLITRLSNIRGINVRPISAVMAFENQAQDSVSIGQDLKVDAVLEGSIYRTNNAVRITARLLRVSDNSPVWTGQFEKPLQDELEIQNEIALQVADALALNLSHREQDALAKHYTESADALQLYLEGRYNWNKRSWEGMIEAERLFRNAIEKDPNFALAYVGLADRLATGADVTEANQVIEKALELDPNLAEAYATKGFIKMFNEWKWQEAEASFKKSIELNPGYATAHQWYATLLEIEGKQDEAKSELRRALEINPMSHNFLSDLGQAYYFAHDYNAAKEYCRKALELYPDFVFAHQYLSDIYLQTGEYDAAIDEALKASQITSTFAHQTDEQKERMEESLAARKEKYRKEGVKEFFADQLITNTEPNSYYGAARIYALLGEKEKALDNLEKAFQRRAFALPFVKADPIFDNLRSEPRFQDLLRRMGFNEQ